MSTIWQELSDVLGRREPEHLFFNGIRKAVPHVYRDLRAPVWRRKTPQQAKQQRVKNTKQQRVKTCSDLKSKVDSISKFHLVTAHAD